MPSLTFLIAALLFSYLTTRGRAKIASYTTPVNDLRNHCAFDLNGYVYDLCPLLGSTKVVEIPEETTTGSQGRRSGPSRYLLALGGFGKENEMVGCGEDTWVCLTSRSLHDLTGICLKRSKACNMGSSRYPLFRRRQAAF
jgi:hypothetical protein